MKTKLAISLIALFLTNTLNAQTSGVKETQGKLTEATVFFRGAELTHTATAALPQGESEIQIGGLASSIDVNSISLGATSGVTVVAYEFSNNHKITRSLNPTIASLQDSLQYYQKKLQRLNAEKTVNAGMLELLQKGMTQKLGTADKNITLAELKASMDYYQTKSIDLTLDADKKTEEIKHCEEAQARIEDELAQNGQNTGALRIRFAAPSAVTSHITISYITYQANWAPYYAINATSADQPIQIVSKARIAQTTGITWNRVKLTLSTGTPNKGKTAPLFQTWFLENQEERDVLNKEVIKMNSVSYKSKEIVSRGLAIPTEPNTMDEYLSVVDNQLVTNYNIDLPYTIPGDGKAQSIDLRTQTAKADFKFYCAPKLDTETYLMAEVKDTENLDLPRGKAQITYDGMYVGESVIEGNSTDENLTLTLGTDKRIAVKREKLQDFSSKKTFGSTITQIFTYQITVKNNQRRSIKLTLKDQYPISSDKSIEVKLLDETTHPTYNKEDIGVVTWEDTFKAGETKTYRLSYSVKYPKDYDLNL